jgi:hypothetical protein
LTEPDEYVKEKIKDKLVDELWELPPWQYQDLSGDTIGHALEEPIAIETSGVGSKVKIKEES